MRHGEYHLAKSPNRICARACTSASTFSCGSNAPKRSCFVCENRTGVSRRLRVSSAGAAAAPIGRRAAGAKQISSKRQRGVAEVKLRICSIINARKIFLAWRAPLLGRFRKYVEGIGQRRGAEKALIIVIKERAGRRLCCPKECSAIAADRKEAARPVVLGGPAAK